MNNKEKGSQGERLAADYIKALGYEILEMNYRLKCAEIDIIAMINGVLVFIEVKYRANLNFGRPCEAVGARKQQKIKQCASSYIAENNLCDIDCRFDIIEIIKNNNMEITHIENAFN